jgi:hypothetical protein
MGQRMASAALPTHSNSLGRSLDAVKGRAARVGLTRHPVPTESNDADKAAFLALIDEARIRAGLSQKEMAISANVDAGTFSSALSGQGRVNFAAHWLHNQPDAFWSAFAKIVLERRGIDEARADELTADRIGELVTLLIKQTRRTA